MRFVYRLGERGRTFSTRPRGAEMRQDLLQQAGSADSVELDFGGVLSISYSFADEFVGALCASEGAGQLPFTLEVVRASEEVDRVIGRALANRVEAAPESSQCYA